MNKALQKALIQVVMMMASMIIGQSNVFGVYDCSILSEKVDKLLEVIGEG